MTTDTQNHQAIRGLLENALQQVLSTQQQVTAIESQLQEIKSQIDLSLEAIDPVLKQCETGSHHAEKVRNVVAATLGEMFEHVSRIVNDAREQMLNPRSDESDFQDVSPDVTKVSTEVLTEAEEALAETVPDEPTPVETLTGPQVGQRATESLNEMIATIDESKVATNTETGKSQEEEDVSEPETEPEIEQLPETVVSEPTLPEVNVTSAEKAVPKGPGSTDSLSELLAKSKAASSETGTPATDLTPLDDEEEDAQTVSELLKTTSGSFVTQ